MSKVYYLSSIFGTAKGIISLKANKTYTLHIELTPKGAPKIAGYLTQTNHETVRAARKSWHDLKTRLEVELFDLGMRQRALNGETLD